MEEHCQNIMLTTNPQHMYQCYGTCLDDNVSVPMKGTNIICIIMLTCQSIRKTWALHVITNTSLATPAQAVADITIENTQIFTKARCEKHRDLTMFITPFRWLKFLRAPSIIQWVSKPRIHERQEAILYIYVCGMIISVRELYWTREVVVVIRIS